MFAKRIVFNNVSKSNQKGAVDFEGLCASHIDQTDREMNQKEVKMAIRDESKLRSAKLCGLIDMLKWRWNE